MKRLSVVIVALVAVLAFAAVTAPAKTKKKKVPTTTTITFNAGTIGPYGEHVGASFSGTVTAKKKCNSGRSVTVTGPPGTVGSATSNSAGAWTVAAPAVVPAGTYTANVAKKKIVKKKKNGKKKKTKCLATTASTTVP